MTYQAKDRGAQRPGAMRAEGLIPAVVYGAEKPSWMFSLREQEVYKIIRGRDNFVDLKIQGKKYQVKVGEIQREPVSKKPLHASFIRLRKGQTVDIEAYLQLVGEAPGTAEGGIIIQTQESLPLRGTPANLPDTIEVDISSLNINDAVHLSDIKIPNDVELMEENLDKTIVTCSAPKMEEEAAEATEETAESAEGDIQAVESSDDAKKSSDNEESSTEGQS